MEKLYLKMEETGLPENETIGVVIRVEVESIETARTLKDEYAVKHFTGKTFTSKLHIHRVDAPCEIQDL